MKKWMISWKKILEESGIIISGVGQRIKNEAKE